MLLLDSREYSWCIHWRGEYCLFGLPHHDAGGERHWISNDAKTKILINVD